MIGLNRELEEPEGIPGGRSEGATKRWQPLRARSVMCTASEDRARRGADAASGDARGRACARLRADGHPTAGQQARVGGKHVSS